ncbi:MAG: FtsX-like permease family protein [Rickettsiales bacterium]|jgi:cell division protein FtsX|nr:FtsX-like permease family protein [Rickettsiales bacterium]
MAAPLVFSFVNEQQRFLFLLIGFLTFLAITSGGIVLSISTAIGRFSSNLARTGIIQVMRGSSIDTAVKIIGESKFDLVSTKTIDKEESAKLLKNWLKSADALSSYIPHTIQVRAKTTEGLDKIAKRAEAAKLKFIYGRGAAPDRSVGIKIMLISGFVFLTILSALILCIIHSVKNIITIHKREIEILNQVGATSNYIARQIQMAISIISVKASLAGLAGGWLVLMLINGLSRSSHVGLLANMGMVSIDWIITAVISMLMVVLAAFITRRATLKILAK